MTTALITGASRGIGREVAVQLAAAGHTVVVTARDLDSARVVADELQAEGHDARALQLDITDDEQVAAAAAALDELDVLVNNAAAFADWNATPTTAAPADVSRLLDVNVVGTWRVTTALLPLLRASDHGRIVNVGSGSGSFGEEQFGLHSGPQAAGYAVSKAAVHAYTAKLAAELADDGILVNAVDPGLTATAPGMEEMGARPVPDGAAGIVWAALLDDDGPTGGLFRDGRPLPV